LGQEDIAVLEESAQVARLNPQGVPRQPLGGRIVRLLRLHGAEQQQRREMSAVQPEALFVQLRCLVKPRALMGREGRLESPLQTRLAFSLLRHDTLTLTPA